MDEILPIAGAALGIALVQWFSTPVPVAKVAHYVNRITRDQLNEEAFLPPREVEAVLRAGLRHEPYLLINIGPRIVAEIQLAMLSILVREMQLGVAQLTQLVGSAEAYLAAAHSDQVPGVGDADVELVARRVSQPDDEHEVRANVRGEKYASRRMNWRWIVQPSAADGPELVPNGPTTIFGHYFRASVMGSLDLQSRWDAQLKQTGNVSLGNGILAVFLLSLDRRFPTFDLDEVAAFVERLHTLFEGAPAQAWPLETEMTIRAALAERDHLIEDVPNEGITPLISHLRLTAAIGMALDLDLTLDELDALIAEAEDMCERNGRALTPV